MFRAQYRLKALQRATAMIWREIDALLLPTTGTIYSIEEVMRDPIRLNSILGCYTNFVNLLDLAAISVPAGFRSNGLPFGVTLIAPSGSDPQLLDWSARLHAANVAAVGALDVPVPQHVPAKIASAHIDVVVCGAHM